MTEISAEMQLGYQYPDMDSNWIVQNKGTFYRNYQSDVMDINESDHVVSLARDGFLHLLPQGIITNDNDIRSKDSDQKKVAWTELQTRKHRLEAAFQPVDTIRFRNRMHTERQISEILHDKHTLILKEIYGINAEDYPSPFVQQFMHLMPNIRRYRGDLESIKVFLSNCTNSEVELIQKRYSDTDTTRQWLIEVIYNIYIDNLSSVEYQEMQEKVHHIEDFLSEWLIPFEVKLRIGIKMRTKTRTIGSSFILDYNIQL